MQAFTVLSALACPLPVETVDTDQLIPARFMSRPRSAGYAKYLLHDLRTGRDGASMGHALDRPEYAGAGVLVSRRNFGAGSSREAAVYALWDFGIRCVIAPSFGDIFAANAVKNGLLPAQVSESDAETLLSIAAAEPGARMTVDLAARTIRAGNMVFPFSIDKSRRQQLLNGWDDYDLTMQHRAAINAFRARRKAQYPWAGL
jgi:3-isopropylmalate/(R)-2-methylmalate dehydratase small subunit